MPGIEDDVPSPFPPLQAELARMRRSTLSSVIGDVDEMIELLISAREKVASDEDSHKISMSMMGLQTPIKKSLDHITGELKDVTKAQKGFGKALDKAMPYRELPMEADAMADQPALINRAIAMHLLREGHFSIASTFLNESQDHPPPNSAFASHSQADQDGDDAMDETDDNATAVPGKLDLGSLQSEDLQHKFSEMYGILSHLKVHDLGPAIRWAQENSDKLEAKGSTLEFDLNRLQFVWLFKGPAVNGLPDDERNSQQGALAYARQNFAKFQYRHLKEMQRLCGAVVYATNLSESPYRLALDTDSSWDDVSLSFTRDFCSLLGLAAESPLYVAVTAGSIALPRLIKYTTYMKEKKTEWTTENELAFETPLPGSMIYHPIFVCPVSKEQATEKNPPVLLSCGHAICRDSLHNLAKGARYKCTYCVGDGHVKDAMKISF